MRAFTCGLVVRGFDVDEGLPLDLGKRVASPSCSGAGHRHRRFSVTVSLTNTSGRCLVFVLAHETYQALGGAAARSSRGRRAHA